MTSNNNSSIQQTYTLEQIALHNCEGDAWLAIDEFVYDVSKFAALHPAGKKVLLQYAGKDATKVFKYFHDKNLLRKYEKLVVGRVQGRERNDKAVVPYGEPSHCFGGGWVSPYHTEEHAILRKAIRTFVEQELLPYSEQWEQDEQPPSREVIKKCAQNGFMALCLGFWPQNFVPKREVCGVELKEPDLFHESIMYDELSRLGSAGIQWAITGGMSVGLPPVLKFGSQELQERVVRQCLAGDKLICLAITEPWAGSDVAGIRATAVKSDCGQYYIVNGMKKWITNGIFCDFFTTAVRTGGKDVPGMRGISLLLLEKGMPGLSLRKMKCMGVVTSGTTFIAMDNVKVPVSNLIGREGEGFSYIMVNFNHERLLMCNQAVALARCAFEEAMLHAHKRKTFGKALIEHPVIRLKLAHMARQIEAANALLYQCLYNYARVESKQIISGAIALLKAHSSQTLEYCAREALQIFGGQGYTKSGPGAKVERIYREVKFLAVPGGSEEILLDLGARQASKFMPKI